MIEKVNTMSKKRLPFFFIVDFYLNKPILFSMDELQKADIMIQFPTFQSKTSLPDIKIHQIAIEKEPPSFESYKESFEKVQKHLHYGNSFLTNLTATTKIQTTSSLSEIYHAASAKYKILFQQEWISFSPESFIQIKNNKIYSFPMKGTIDASVPNAKELILSDAKEKAEHFTIVDLIRNDLSLVSTYVTVEDFRYIESIETPNKKLYQVSSRISGQLPNDYLNSLGNIIFSLLPAGSISGAPKQKTLEIIHEAENYQRGYYTGVAFYFDGQDLDSCVLIRFIEQTPQGLVYKSGGGITVNSEVEKEYQELIDKVYVPCI